MYQLIGTLIDVGLVASAVLGVASVAGRVATRRRTRRWIKAIDQAGIDQPRLELSHT